MLFMILHTQFLYATEATWPDQMSELTFKDRPELNAVIGSLDPEIHKKIMLWMQTFSVHRSQKDGLNAPIFGQPVSINGFELFSFHNAVTQIIIKHGIPITYKEFYNTIETYLVNLLQMRKLGWSNLPSIYFKTMLETILSHPNVTDKTTAGFESICITLTHITKNKQENALNSIVETIDKGPITLEGLGEWMRRHDEIFSERQE